LPKKKKLEAVPSTSYAMGTVFFDAEGCSLFKLLPQGETFSAARYL
jgi:hypothetical protein